LQAVPAYQTAAQGWLVAGNGKSSGLTESGAMSAVIATPQKIDLRRLPVLAKNQMDRAQLPERYRAAVAALRECHRIDELKDIEDKHSAIAHYAKQIKDESMRYYAERIRLRAFERIGELLAEIPDPIKRREAAEAGGISIPTANRAVEAAQIPRKVRDKLIEKTPPPNRKALADYGREYSPTTASYRTPGLHRYLRREEEIKHTAHGQAYELFTYLRSILEDLKMFCSNGCGGTFTMAELGRAISHPGDAKECREMLVSVIEQLDEMEAALIKEPLA
jgi:hypothetical protein